MEELCLATPRWCRRETGSYQATARQRDRDQRTFRTRCRSGTGAHAGRPIEELSAVTSESRIGRARKKGLHEKRSSASSVPRHTAGVWHGRGLG